MKILYHFMLYQMHLAKAWTFYTDEECAALEKYAAGKKRLVEIGCWQGVNTSRLRRTMASDGILFAVDPYAPGRLGFNASQVIAHREVAKVRRGSVRWIQLTDLEAAHLLTQEKQPPLDFIFSDSLNTYEGFQKTWEAWNPLLAPAGIYIIANSAPTTARPIHQAGSVRFTREVISKDLRFEVLETVGTFTILRKKRS